MVYFTSDLHFYHEKIIKHTNRPFKNFEQMNNCLINNWNSKMTFQDEIYILGDFTMKGPQLATNILLQLKGKKHLICGNHDKFVMQSNFDQLLFQSIQEYKEIQYLNTQFILSHYPMLEWNGFYKGSIHLHGHQHNKEWYNFDNFAKGIRRFDVGVDANYMSPVSAEDIITFFSLN
ncbi:hydrolase [Candidatus Epulonipiscium fishelsonii]|uniref:Hydrolase n=1 Tax=Candidatus Epulonipiscium fishelsonii TaxID=77094 RepID=A0ACC8XEE9_9FIRM|nr:hydrolase [Epulopiscium sp. SCG-B05WGA-EpuloA1]ONI41089.1 hydrolase [Epulopiscium sp. SCG-B11WGA-EpuloA1]